MQSDISDLLTAERTAILSLTNPLLDAFGVEHMHLVAVERGDEIIP